MKSFFRIVLIIVFCQFIIFPGFAKNCQEVRGGLDIGSGSTKMMVAKVDFCQKKVLEVLMSESRPIQYNEDLERNSDKILSLKIIEEGRTALGDLLAKARKFKPKRMTGVATSVFRKAKNGKSVIASFQQSLKIKLEVISQVKEAELGYFSATALIDQADREKGIIVWDIGGGSMQIFALDSLNKPIFYLGDLASVTFKNLIIEVLQQKKLESTSSPNPIGPLASQSVAFAKWYAKLHVPLAIRELLHKRIVVGVGGVHAISLKNQLALKEMKYNLDMLTKKASEEVKKSDQELFGDYRSTDVSNLLLVQGFMEGLGIDSVKVLNTSLLHGILIN